MKPNEIDYYLLCEPCKKLGYCMQKAIRESQQVVKQTFFGLPIPTIIIDNNPISDREIAQWVTIRTNIKDANTKFGKKLQQAHELFHQDEFEQASYMYQDMLETRNDCDEVKIGLAASFYFLHKFEDAANTAIMLSDSFHKSLPHRLANHCELKLEELRLPENDEHTSTKNVEEIIDTKTKQAII